MVKESIYNAFLRSYKVFPSEHKIKFWISLFLLFINSILELIGLGILFPLFSILLSDNFIEKNNAVNRVYNALNFSNQDHFVLFICGFVIIFILLKAITSIYIAKFQSKFAFSLYSHFAINLQKLNYSKGFLHFKQNNSAFLIRDINGMPIYFAQSFILPSLMLINEFIVITFLLVSILVFNPFVVLLLALTVAPISFFAYLYVKKQIKGIGKIRVDQAAEIHNNLEQSIHGYSDVKMTNTEHYFFSEYSKLVKEFTNVQIKSNVLMMLPTKVIEGGTFLGLIAFLLFSYFFIPDKASISMLLGLFAISAFRILPSINRIMASLLSIKEHQFSVDKITQIKLEDNWNNYYDKPIQNVGLTFEKDIKIENINFSYNIHDRILNQVNMTINKGETVGIIGRSGSGKTTLINIILRFLKETSGGISVDNALLTDENMDKWRGIIGFVQQDVYIIDGTLTENIAFGIPENDIDYPKLMNCIEQASLLDLVNNWSKGINTQLGERGAQLSGGQRQRVGIARALYSNSKILLFDEATSALDNETEVEITESIKKLAENNLTMIIIAHRYTTLKYCDRIIELRNGEVLREYKYNELVNL